jgi:hypothetical protein
LIACFCSRRHGLYRKFEGLIHVIFRWKFWPRRALPKQRHGNLPGYFRRRHPEPHASIFS